MRSSIAPIELDTAEGHLMINVREATGWWIRIKVSTREINVGFINNENHRWSNKNEGISSGTEEKICSFRHRALTSLTRTRKWNVLYPPTCCPSSLPRCVTQGYTTWILRLFHQADLKFSGPVLNCHTCSYMNDQGKCLQGEGVCSTQNSQQCMLKKIFEGMWGLHEPVFAREHINQLEYWWGGDTVAGAEEGTSCDSPETWRSRRTLSFQESRAEFQLLRERPFPAGLRCIKKRQGDWLSLPIKEMCGLPLETLTVSSGMCLSCSWLYIPST